MKYKEIPITLINLSRPEQKPTFITKIKERPSMITFIWGKFNKLYNIYKIYHVRGKGAWIETKRRPYTI